MVSSRWPWGQRMHFKASGEALGMHIVPRIAIASGILALSGAAQVASAQSGSELAQKKSWLIKQGSNGARGRVPMPPQTALSDAEIKTLAAWVLSVP